MTRQLPSGSRMRYDLTVTLLGCVTSMNPVNSEAKFKFETQFEAILNFESQLVPLFLVPCWLSIMQCT